MRERSLSTSGDSATFLQQCSSTRVFSLATLVGQLNSITPFGSQHIFLRFDMPQSYDVFWHGARLPIFLSAVGAGAFPGVSAGAKVLFDGLVLTAES